MDILETIKRIKAIFEEDGLNIDKASKAQHWLYRSSDKIPRRVAVDLIMFT